jgi:hypothetical protein
MLNQLAMLSGLGKGMLFYVRRFLKIGKGGKNHAADNR